MDQYRVRHALTAPIKRPDSGTKLVQVTGFNHVVIGSAVQGPNAVGDPFPRGQHQNRDLVALDAQLLEAPLELQDEASLRRLQPARPRPGGAARRAGSGPLRP